MTVQHVAVPAGKIPPLPANAVATVHSRDLPAQPAAPAPAPQPLPQGANPLDGLVLPTAPQPKAGQEPDQPAQPVPAQPQGIDPTLLQLLAGLTQGAQPAAAVAPAPAAQPAPAPTAPAASGIEGALRGVLSGSGVDVERAVAKAIEYGDANLIDIAHLTEKGGANAQHLVQVAQALVTNAVETERRQVATLHARAGGEANFNSAVQAFNSSAPEQVKMIVKALTDSDNEAQVLAGVDLMLQYARGATMQPAGLVQSGAGATMQGGLSKDGFQAELGKLDRNAVNYGQQREELFARRALGKHQGL